VIDKTIKGAHISARVTSAGIEVPGAEVVLISYTVNKEGVGTIEQWMYMEYGDIYVIQSATPIDILTIHELEEIEAIEGDANYLHILGVLIDRVRAKHSPGGNIKDGLPIGKSF